MTRRDVRVSDAFFVQLDQQFGSERADDGAPSATDFLIVELPTILERFALEFDQLPQVIGGFDTDRLRSSCGLSVGFVGSCSLGVEANRLWKALRSSQPATVCVPFTLSQNVGWCRAAPRRTSTIDVPSSAMTFALADEPGLVQAEGFHSRDADASGSSTSEAPQACRRCDRVPDAVTRCRCP